MSLEDVVVLDAGSHTFKAGFGANIPSETEPSVVSGTASRGEVLLAKSLPHPNKDQYLR